MAPLPSFAVTGNLKDVFGIVSGGELVESAMTRAQVRFLSNIPDEHFITWEGELKHVNRTIDAVVNIDGDVLTEDGDTVLLLANDSGLNVRNLQWQVRITLPSSVIPPLSAATMRAWWIDAENDGGTVDLATSVAVPGMVIHGVESKGDTGDPGAPVDDVALVGDDVQFYVQGTPIGDPLALTIVDISEIDGGTPSDPGLTTIDGGTP